MTSNFRTASSTTKWTVDLGRVLSTADKPTMAISRDAGISVQYSSNPPRALWIFADSGQEGNDFPFWYGTAAAGPFTPGAAPTTLTELPNGTLSSFFPVPQGLLKVDGSACTASDSGGNLTYPAAWVKGAANIPGGSTILVVHTQVCVEIVGAQITITHERLGFSEYNPISKTMGTVVTPFEASPLQSGLSIKKRLQSPVFGNDGYLYLFAGQCDGPGPYSGSNCSDAAAVYLARVPDNAFSWSQPSPYQWWNGQNWGSAANAANLIPGSAPIFRTLSVNDYSATTLKKYVLIEETGFRTGTFRTWLATSITGPWTAGPKSQVPDDCDDGGSGLGCYSIYGHPELSNTSQLVFSWFSPKDPGEGHLRVGAMPW